MHHNVQCLKNKIENIEVFLSTANIDILCVSESWIQANEIDYINFPGYSIKSFYCRKSFIHGGVLLIVKNTLNVMEMSNVVSLSIDKTFECAAIKLNVNNVIYYILCLYRSPQSDITTFFLQFEKCLNLLFCKNQCFKIIICGDININYLNKNNETAELIDLVSSFYIKPVFDEPTRLSNKSSTAIDYIFTNFNDSLVEKNVLHTGLSDHSAQQITFNCITNKNFEPYKYRSFSRKNILQFTDYLKAETWDNVLIENNIENKYKFFYETLLYYYDTSFKMVTKNFNHSSDNKNWLTTGIKTSSKRLKELFNLQKLGIIEKTYYVNYKTTYNRVIRHAKKMYFDNIINNSENKTRTVWNIINSSIRGANKQIKNDTSTMMINNVEVDNKILIANEFNSYFINLPKSVIKSNQQKINNHDMLSIVDESIVLHNVTESEIINVINNLKNSNSTGHDNFSIKIIKQCAHLLAKPLCNIINHCFAEGHFPDLLKISKVICLFKKGDSKQICNYRPISLLSVFSKIIEKLLANRIILFLESNNMLSPNQHGFRVNRSTISALLSFLNHVYKNLDEGNKVMALFVDLSKAFDCVDHDTLLKKVECYGLRGQCNKILRSYLMNRKQFVEYYGKRSQEMEVNIGVPQGSVLGPLLFLLYINDIENFISTFYCAFADDISLLSCNQDVNIMSELVQDNLISLFNYFTSNNLAMNQEKTFSMQFHPVGANYISSPLIKFQNRTIEQVKDFKLLGIYVDMSLNWKVHIDYVCKKCASICFALKRLCQIASKNVVKIFYYSNFESTIRYGVICWGNSSTANRVFVLQKRALRSIYGLQYRESCKQTFISQKILTLPCLYILEILTFVKKNLDRFTFQNISHEYNTRHGENLQHSLHRLELYKSNPYYVGTVLYNKLDISIKTCNLKKFISAVKNMLLTNAFYSVDEYLAF